MTNSAIEKFDEILHVLNKVGALKRLILVGSWCLLVYREYYRNELIPALRTMDLDFLIEKPNEKLPVVDVPKALSNLGFELFFDVNSPLVKFERTDLEIEFLCPRLRTKDVIVNISHLNLTAQILSYMEIAQKYSKVLEYKGISLKVPEPEAFVLHKVLVYPLRGDSPKKQKDLFTVTNLFEVIVGNQESLNRMKEIFMGFPKKWRHMILKTTKKDLPQIEKVLI